MMRKAMVSRVGRNTTTKHLYFLIDNGGLCVYCGERSEKLDESVPHSIKRWLSMIGKRPDGRLVLEACEECARIGKDMYFKTVAKKRKFIRTELAEMYRQLSDIPQWESEELKDMAYVFQIWIKGTIGPKRWLTKRLSWQNRDNRAFARTVGPRFIQYEATSGSAVSRAELSGMQRLT